MHLLLIAASAATKSPCPIYKPENAHVVWIPANLNLNELIRRKPIEQYKQTLQENELLDSLAMILGTLTDRYTGTFYRIKSLDEPVHISSRYLKKLTDHYSSLLTYLIDSEVIEVHTPHKRGQRSTSFRYGVSYRQYGLRKYYIKNHRFTGKLHSYRTDTAAIQKQPELFSFLRGLSIDAAGAKEVALDLAGADKDLYSLYCKTIENVNLEDPKFRIDNSAGRLHSFITSLKKEFRPFLRYKDQHLVALDIKTSQPYFLATLHNKLCWQSYDIVGMILRYSQHLTPLQIRKAKVQLWKNSLNSASNRYTDRVVASVDAASISDPSISVPPDEDYFFQTYSGNYVDMVLSGKLYENIAEFIGSDDREVGKEQMFKILYNPPHFKSNGKSLFKEHFTAVDRFCDTINTGYYKTKAQGRTNNEQSSTLALLLQTLEAKFILDTVIPDLLEVFPKLPLFTIHDSILIPVGLEKEVVQVIEGLGKRYLGLTPIISFEYY